VSQFQQIAILLIVIWFVMVIVRFRRSGIVLAGGLFALGAYTLAALLTGEVTLKELGLSAPPSWLLTGGLALLWLGLMLAYSPIADRLASRWFAQPPGLDAFRSIQQSKVNLVAGIAAAWVMGGFLEELLARGIVLQSVAAGLTPWLSLPGAVGAAVCLAALGAGLLHSYQGPRAVAIVTQLSLLFGLLFVISGFNLWAVIVCHGLYDTIAFIRFAAKKSKYSNLKAT
jgi:uncharacterized protein